MNMNTNILDSIESLEKHLLRWEKWWFVCAGATLTLLAEAFLRGMERRYIVEAFLFLNPHGGALDQPSLSLQAALEPAWRWLLWFVVEIAALFPGIAMAVHSTWRKIPLQKRLNLMFGYFLCAWLTLLALLVQDPDNVSGFFYLLLIVTAPLLTLTYSWLRYKERKAETLFP